ncbi:hypothetical protein DLAC_02978 [Tieghemostelium lacteum]|uniref:Uncharacterized protein n=1 Tax=Tieghemostelium lacteum TaxID=361077 RepID=A0A152A3S3_TIELA|nr:hypothetical protein DLAC_02978 [Tieghemostelium lacteum]|eukprot:KYR00913.1 hypothetical protein DLAC_02978 [Tieghemostelium lacteum]
MKLSEIKVFGLYVLVFICIQVSYTEYVTITYYPPNKEGTCSGQFYQVNQILVGYCYNAQKYICDYKNNQVILQSYLTGNCAGVPSHVYNYTKSACRKSYFVDCSTDLIEIPSSYTEFSFKEDCQGQKLPYTAISYPLNTCYSIPTVPDTTFYDTCNETYVTGYTFYYNPFGSSSSDSSSSSSIEWCPANGHPYIEYIPIQENYECTDFGETYTCTN